MYRMAEGENFAEVEIAGSSNLEHSQRRNVYGSLVAENSPTPAQEEQINNCSCKSACKTKKRNPTSKGCPCKTAEKRCSTACKCSTSKCANRSTETTDHPRALLPISSIERQSLDRQQSQERAQVFVADLSIDQKDKLLVRLLTSGRGNIDFARNLLRSAENDEEPNVPDPNEEHPRPSWCVCKNCRPMQTPEENKCCRKRECITSYEMFVNICLDRHVLEMAIRSRCDIRVEALDFSMASFRKAGYRQFILWEHGTLGRGNRKIIPSCAVLSIRRRFPSPDDQYMGYRDD